ncbi:dihydrofolate reductase family protein, partial [Kibdelosporangium lantanae]
APSPPCHQALVDAGVARVVVAVIDPTSRGAGGVARLRAAGVDVQVGLLEDEALVVLGPWLGALRMGRPRVTWACAGDGFGMLPDAVVSELRFQVDAVVGVDGRVEEGVPGSHGADVLTLPPEVSTSDPVAALSALYDAGARMVLLHGGQELAGPFVDGRVVDEVVAVVEPCHAGSSLAGFGVKSVRRLASGVLVTMTAKPT